MNPGQRWLSVRDTAELLGVSRGLIERLRAELGAVEVTPRCFRIPVEGLELWLRIHRTRKRTTARAVNASLIDRARREATR